jgi:hypothetical protein
VQFQLQRSLDWAGPVDDGGRGVGLPPGDGVNEEEFLLDADRERPL